MGISSDGQLFFGWAIPDVESGDCIDKDHAQYTGWSNVNIDVSDDDYANWETKDEHCPYSSKDAEVSCLVVDMHCSYSYPMPLIVHRDFINKNSRGFVELISMPSESEVKTMRDSLMSEARRLGFDVEALGEPEFLLTSMYG